jgi:hypothetical protein
VARSGVFIRGASSRRPVFMVHAWLDLSRRLDVCLLLDQAELVEQTAAPADADGLHGLVARVARYQQPVRAVVGSREPRCEDHLRRATRMSL